MFVFCWWRVTPSALVCGHSLPAAVQQLLITHHSRMLLLLLLLLHLLRSASASSAARVPGCCFEVMWCDVWFFALNSLASLLFETFPPHHISFFSLPTASLNCKTSWLNLSLLGDSEFCNNWILFCLKSFTLKVTLSTSQLPHIKFYWSQQPLHRVAEVRLPNWICLIIRTSAPNNKNLGSGNRERS